MTSLLTDGLKWWSETAPQRPAIVFDGHDVVDFRTLHHWTDNAAHFLAAAGLKQGERVGIVGANSLEWCAAALGALKLGAVVAPYNNRFIGPELRQLATDSQPTLVLTDDDAQAHMGEALAGSDVRLVGLREFTALRHNEHQSFTRPTVGFDDVAVIIYTSGTTSAPKGVLVTHRSAFNFMAELAMAEPALRPGGRIIFTLSMSGAPGLLWHVLQPLARGMTLFYERGFDAKAVLTRLASERIEVMAGVPLQFERMAALPDFADADLSSLKLATISGARATVSTIRAWLDKGVPLRQAYGMTELNGLSSVNPAEEAVSRPESIGRGSVFTPHRVVRPDGTDCDSDEQGEIVVNGPSITPGYWRNDEATKAAWRDGWFHTGDVGVRDSDGFIRLVDRMKDLIISGGFNIAPSEIEAVISELPGIEEVCVISAADEKFGETPAAIIYSSQPVDVSAVVDFCRRRLAGYKIPRFVVVEAVPLPRMASGKIARRQIQALHADIAANHPRIR